MTKGIKGPFLSGVIAGVAVFYGCSIYYNGKISALNLTIERQKSGQLTQAIISEREFARKTRELEVKFNAERDQLVRKTYKLQEQVKSYVESSISDNDRLSDEWVRIHDKSAPMPGTPKATGGIDQTNSELRNAKEALRVVTENYGKCQMVVDRLRGWQLWYEEISRSGRQDTAN